MKITIGDSRTHKNPRVRKGWSNWIENGIWYKAKTVNPRTHGGHAYDNGGYELGIRDCPCGCYMGVVS